MKQNPKTNKLEDSYKVYFDAEDTDENDDNASLLQPSPLKYVESFTTSEITDDLPIHKGNS